MGWWGGGVVGNPRYPTTPLLPYSDSLPQSWWAGASSRRLRPACFVKLEDGEPRPRNCVQTLRAGNGRTEPRPFAEDRAILRFVWYKGKVYRIGSAWLQVRSP